MMPSIFVRQNKSVLVKSARAQSNSCAYEPFNSCIRGGKLSRCQIEKEQEENEVNTNQMALEWCKNTKTRDPPDWLFQKVLSANTRGSEGKKKERKCRKQKA